MIHGQQGHSKAKRRVTRPASTKQFKRKRRNGSTPLRYEVVGEDIINPGKLGLALCVPGSEIRTLILCNNRLKDEDFVALNLARLVSSLDKLVLRNQLITDAALEALLAALVESKPQPRLTDLDLCDNEDITTHGALGLGVWAAHCIQNGFKTASFRFHHSTIGTLQRSMAGQRLGPLDAAYLSAQLRDSFHSKDQKVVVLHLGNNQIGSEGAVLLAKALASNSTLKELDLHQNEIKRAGWHALYDALCENSFLRLVDLRMNWFKVGPRFEARIKHDAPRMWPALSRLVLLLDQGSWKNGLWNSSQLGSLVLNKRRKKRKAARRVPQNVGENVPNSVASPSFTRFDAPFKQAFSQPSTDLSCDDNDPFTRETQVARPRSASDEIRSKLGQIQKIYDSFSHEPLSLFIKPCGVSEPISPKINSYEVWKANFMKKKELAMEKVRRSYAATESAKTTASIKRDKSTAQIEKEHASEILRKSQTLGERRPSMIGMAVLAHKAHRNTVRRLSVHRDKSAAAVKLQCMVRRHFALAKVMMAAQTRAQQNNVQAILAAKSIQKAIRRRSAVELEKKGRMVSLIQKHFRQYIARRKFMALGLMLAHDPLVKAAQTLKLTLVKIDGCGHYAACGTYELAGAGADLATQKYIREDPVNHEILVLERSGRVWRICSVANNNGEMLLSTLYVNHEQGISLVPPRQGWETTPATAEESDAIPILSFPEHDTGPDKDDQVMVKGTMLKQDSIRVVDAGCNAVNGLYILSNETSDGCRVFEKHDMLRDKVYSIRRISYLGGRKLWVLMGSLSNKNSNESQETSQVTSEKLNAADDDDQDQNLVEIYYVNSEAGDSDDPPDAESPSPWERGADGITPFPMLIWQDAANRRRKRESIMRMTAMSDKSWRRSIVNLKEIREENGDGCLHRAARRIQVCFRSYLLLNLTRSALTLKQLSSITALTVSQCGNLSCRGTFLLSGKSATSNSMSYILETGGASGVVFIMERIRNGTVWAILRMDSAESIPDIIYFNRQNGYSLMPPRVGWETSHKIHSPSPEVRWLIDGEDDEDDEESFEDEDGIGDMSDDRNALSRSEDQGKNENSDIFEISPAYHPNVRPSISAKAIRRGTRIQDKFKNAVFVTDSGSVTVHARYEEHGMSDGVPAYRSNRDPSVQLRRVQHGLVKLWVIIRVSSTEFEPNLIYYYNSARGTADEPATEGWTCYTADEPPPLVVFQDGCVKSQF